MNCPDCDSGNVSEINNLRECNDCDHTWEE